MKSLIVAFIFAIGLMLALPDPSLGSCSPPGQASFVVDHQAVVPTAAMLKDNYTFDQIGNVKYQTYNCRKGGGVEVQVLNLVTQRTYLINNKMKTHNFTEYSNLSLRTCLNDKVLKGQKLQKHNVFVHRFARDGLTQV